MNGGHHIAKTIAKQGVQFIFTLCGGHISPILSGCKKEGIRVIDTRHEVNAVFAADAVSRITGIPGVVAVTAGPGVTNTITAVKNASLAQSAIVLIGGAAATVLKGRGALQDIDQMALMKPHVKWTASIRKIKDIAPVLELAFQRAAEGVPGPVFIECPIDLLYDEALVRQWYGASSDGKAAQNLGDKALKWYLKRHVGRMFAGAATVREGRKAKPPSIPMHSAWDIRAVMAQLKKAERPVFVIGSQVVLDAENVDMLARAIEQIDVPVYLSGMARGLLGKDHPLQSRHKRRNALREADLILLAGVPCDFRLDYGRHLNRNAVYIGVNRLKEDLNRNKRPKIGILADPGRFLIALAGAISPLSQPDWSEWKITLSDRNKAREKDIDRQADAEVSGINPLKLFRELEPLLNDNAILVADGGDFVATASYTLQPRKPLSWLDPGVFGTLGVGGGFALGAALAVPGSEVWIIYGDGSSAYSLAEFDTFTRHGIPVIALVGNDACWAQIARDQIEILNDDVACMLTHADYDQVAVGYGGLGTKVSTIDQFKIAVDQARNAMANGRPFLINAIIGKTDFRKGSISM